MNTNTPPDFFAQVDDTYGVEEDGLAGNDDIGIAIPQISIQLSDEQKRELQATINPLADCDDYGISLYLQTLHLLQSWNIAS